MWEQPHSTISCVQGGLVVCEVQRRGWSALGVLVRASSDPPPAVPGCTPLSVTPSTHLQ